MVTGPDRRALWTAAAVLAAGFVALAVWVAAAESIPGDERVVVEVTDAVGTSLDDVMVAIGAATDSLVLAGVAVVVAVVLLRSGQRDEALVFALAFGVVVLVNPLLKELVARPRPDVRPSPESLSTYSFPSGHAATSAGFAGAVLLVAPRRWRRWAIAVGVSAIATVAVSRVVIGVHYPSDILGGWLWVAAWMTALRSARVDGRPGHGDSQAGS